MSKVIYFSTSILLIISSIMLVALAIALDYEGMIMASQSLLLLAGVVSLWSMTALLAGK